MRTSWLVLNIVTLLLLSSCFGGPGFMGQTKRGKVLIDARQVKVDVDGEVLSAAVSAGASFTQVVTAPEGTSLSGVSAAFSPGSLVIDTKIVVEEAAPFANERLLAELGIQNTFTAASVAVAIQPAVKSNPAQPFQIALPMPGLNTLNLSGNDHVVIAYRYEDAATGNIISGIMPNSSLQFSDGRVHFYAKYFGIFQATVTEQKVVAAVDAISESTILTKRETAKLAPMQLLNRKPLVIQAGKTVEITGQNIRPSLFLAVNGKPVTKVDVKSDVKAQFIMPAQTRLGLATITAEQDGTTEKLSLVYTNPNDYPVITLAETEVCAGSKYYDLNGTLKTGTKNCGPTINWPSSNGTAGQILGTDGNGNLNWINAPSGGGGMVTSTEIVDGTITDADINASANISFLKISGLGNAASKSIGVTAGDVAAGIHSHTMQDIAEASSCSSSQVLTYTGSSWMCMPMPVNTPPSVMMPGASYSIVNPTGSLLVANTNDSMWTLPSAMGTGYSITVKNNSNGLLKIMPSSGPIDGDSAPFFLYTKGSATFTYSGTQWYVTSVQGDYGRVMPELCGGGGDECYDDSAAMAATFARTPAGKMLVYITNSFGTSVWKEKNGERLLAANGSDNWSMQLNPDGKGESVTPMIAWQQITGHVCPPHIYVDDSNKAVAGKCLYYVDMGSHMLSEAGTSQTLPNMGLGSWSTEAWYAGNIKACGEKGMRLPTIFETATTQTSSGYFPAADGTPTFAVTNGVPSPGGMMLTATTSNMGSNYFIMTDNASTVSDMASMIRPTRCVFY